LLSASSEDEDDDGVRRLGVAGLVDSDDAAFELLTAWLIDQLDLCLDGGPDVEPQPGRPLAPREAVGSVCLGPCYADIKSSRKRCETIVPRSQPGVCPGTAARTTPRSMTHSAQPPHRGTP